MRETGKNIINTANTAIKEKIGLLNAYKNVTLEIDLQEFRIPNFEKPEKENLIDFNTWCKPFAETLKNKPCIYVFEIIKDNTQDIIKAYSQLNKANKSAVKKTIDYNSRCLYIGKSKSTIIHRLKVHLGYKNTTENGLQLLHWAQKLKLQLHLSIYVFPKEVDFLLPYYEANFSKEYKPLIGHL